MPDNLFSKFDPIESKFEDIERQLSDPEVISNTSKYQELLKKHAELKESVETYRSYKSVFESIEEATLMLEDPEMKEMATEELRAGKTRLKELEDTLQFHLIPKDPDDHKNAIVEIRSGTGGEEAALFAEDLFAMYKKYADTKKWTVEVLAQQMTPIGGIKEVVFLVSGVNVFSQLKYEVGTHRVQRVPSTETQGRVHTSAATVAILPEAEDVDIDINPKDLRIDTFRASGAGGQHVNKTSSAIRITHIPTNTVVECQDERSQHQNKDKAMKMLRSRMYDSQMEQKRKEESAMRKTQVGSGDRSEKIRTYNYPQGRVTDHRINLTLYTLDKTMEGDLDPVVEALVKADQLAKMQDQ